MLTYFGHLNESLESFLLQVRKYCQAHGIDMDAPEIKDQVIAFIAGTYVALLLHGTSK